MDLKIIYEDENVLAVDKPAGIVVFAEGKNDGEPRRTIIQILLEKYPELEGVGLPPRYGVVHRLDKDTSGILLVAKTSEVLIFLQKQFINTTTAGSVFSSLARDRKISFSLPHSLENRTIEKRYIALATGHFKDNSGRIETLIGRSPQNPRKQKAHDLEEPKKTGLREAITEYKVLERFASFTLLEVSIKTGRKHQIRCHLAHIHHPIAGDKVYGFKDSPVPEGLKRQFLHASYMKIKLPDGETKELNSELPKELNEIIKNLKN